MVSERFLPRDDLDRLIAVLAEGGRAVIGSGRPRRRARLRADRRGGGAAERLDRRPGAGQVSAPPRGRADVRRRPAGAGAQALHVSLARPAERGRARRGRGRHLHRGGARSAAPRLPRRAGLRDRGLLVQDRVLAGGPFVDADYRARRAAALVVAVECTRAGSTCFCTSMGTGPEVDGGADIVLSELDEGFVVRAGDRPRARRSSSAGSPCGRPPTSEADAAGAQVAAVRAAIGDPVPADGLPERLRAASIIRAGPRSPSAASPARTARWSARPASARASASPRTSTASRRRPSDAGTAASASASAGSPATPTSGRRPRIAIASG